MANIETTPDHYLIDGRRYDRVTRILEMVPSPELDAWRLRVGEAAAGKKMREAARRGDKVHAYIAAALKKQKLPTITKTIAPYIKAWDKWCLKASLEETKTVAVEQTVWSTSRMYAGTLDYACLTKWGNYLVDWKTSAMVTPSHIYQLHAYSPLFNQQQGFLSYRDWQFKRVRVVRLDGETEDFDEEQMDYNPELFEGFLALARGYQVHRKWFYPNG